MDNLTDYECPVCDKAFRTQQGVNAHLSTAKRCKFWKQGKRVDLGQQIVLDWGRKSSPGIDEGEGQYNGEGGDTSGGMGEQTAFADNIDSYGNHLDNDQFHFIPEPDEEVEIGQAGPGPATSAHRARGQAYRALDEDDDTRITVTHPTAGRAIRMDTGLHEQWKAIFKESGHDDRETCDPGMQPESQADGVNPYAPFASELDFKVARWVIQDGIGHASLDRLLDIPGVRLNTSIQIAVILTFAPGEGAIGP